MCDINDVFVVLTAPWFPWYLCCNLKLPVHHCMWCSVAFWILSMLHRPLQDATCCDDHQHCCPNNLPVCDTAAGRCLSGNANDWESSVPWSTKVCQTCSF